MKTFNQFTNNLILYLFGNFFSTTADTIGFFGNMSLSLLEDCIEH